MKSALEGGGTEGGHGKADKGTDDKLREWHSEKGEGVKKNTQKLRMS